MTTAGRPPITGRQPAHELVGGAVNRVAVGVNRDELRIRAIGHKLGNALGVAVAGMENNNGLGHEKTPEVQKNGKPNTGPPRKKRKRTLATSHAHRANET
jgi:hypothetical protein